MSPLANPHGGNVSEAHLAERQLLPKPRCRLRGRLPGESDP